MRLLLATLLGGLIGWERESNSRPAGFRTNILVCVGAALIMVVSIGLYHLFQSSRAADPSRIAAQVVSGIGFLGAGTIIREGFSVKGLTTAASLWAVAGVGLAVGAGFYFSAISGTVLIFLTLSILNTIEHNIAQKSGLRNLRVKVFDQPGEVGKIGSVLGDYNVHIVDVSIDHIRNEPNIYVNLQVRVPDDLNQNQVIQHLAQTTGVIQVEWKEGGS
ncbi:MULTISPECIES: MgtC/SapB family protein [unclassified Candidatus Frackibacter]|uniref:MgtC/SapB family protein n=1 Tax=unclassified Candidatus Frackibacter TaxID=2648818 RepID=UPI0007938E8C|nr:MULTISPECIES: MgtC/SapB family protein [unclassified Candidatus Frackibacter]KXS40867.1 MAG: putative Mg2+ transporter-C (MgtC) family protein [Candidatus Frackibacter sp. T328-2]SDB98596.1 putative Mg2+ transporter-C (MgtC) family protein [Candidatus Frackibacter sp. WG11]SEM30377.1 putative Mg2+ transporter-C (MgtC) family protein [Candidatus Frackibacter sp. WG12]SFL35332.1 putative Mg2+ transporter-C (MgtC) family protein [Candidatus Frackibacter sp. WG13]